ncbi:hypothetical protein KBI33_00285 [Candidatus Shapirobacteria bacterium]|nr:hypothetical protein [Candidatus Shapirobacteria bacterium]
MVFGKGKITSTVSNLGKNALGALKEETDSLKRELENQLGVSPATAENDQEKKKQNAAVWEEKKREKKKAKERENIRDIEKKLAMARQQIAKERKEKEKIRDNQLTESDEHRPVVYGLPANDVAAENYPPELEKTPLPPSRPRRGFFPQRTEKFKKKE